MLYIIRSIQSRTELHTKPNPNNIIAAMASKVLQWCFSKDDGSILSSGYPRSLSHYVGGGPCHVRAQESRRLFSLALSLQESSSIKQPATVLLGRLGLNFQLPTSSPFYPVQFLDHVFWISPIPSLWICSNAILYNILNIFLENHSFLHICNIYTVPCESIRPPWTLRPFATFQASNINI